MIGTPVNTANLYWMTVGVDNPVIEPLANSLLTRWHFHTTGDTAWLTQVSDENPSYYLLRGDSLAVENGWLHIRSAESEVVVTVVA